MPDRGESGEPGEGGSDREDDQPGRYTEAGLEAAEVKDEDQAQGDQSHHGVGEGAEEEVKREEGDARPGERGQQCRPRRGLSDALGHEGPEEFDEARAEAGHQARLPGDGVRIRPALLQGDVLGGQHDEEHVGDQGGGVDAVGQGADIRPLLPPRHAMRLPRVEDIPAQVGNRDPGKDPAVDQGRRETEDPDAQGRYQEQFDEVIEGDREETIHVAPAKEFHGALSAATRLIVNNAACRAAKGDRVR